MTVRRVCLALVLAVSAGLSLQAQTVDSTAKEPSLDNGSLKEQYNYMIEKSNDYQDYKVIKKSWTQKFEKSLSDSLQAMDKRKKTADNLALTQQTEIDKLKAKMGATQDSLQLVREQKNNMAFVGVNMEKTSYRTLMWSLIGVLTILLLIFIFRFKNSNAVTRQAKGTLADVEEEFAEYKKRSLEREQKLRRELQDEINKQKVKN